MFGSAWGVWEETLVTVDGFGDMEEVHTVTGIWCVWSRAEGGGYPGVGEPRTGYVCIYIYTYIYIYIYIHIYIYTHTSPSLSIITIAIVVHSIIISSSIIIIRIIITISSTHIMIISVLKDSTAMLKGLLCLEVQRTREVGS